MKIDIPNPPSLLNQFAIKATRVHGIFMTATFAVAILPVLIFDVFFGIFGINNGDRAPLLDRTYLELLIWLFGVMCGFWWLHYSLKGDGRKWWWLIPLVLCAAVLRFVL